MQSNAVTCRGMLRALLAKCRGRKISSDIAASRDARRDKKLEDATQVALANIRQPDGQAIDPRASREAAILSRAVTMKTVELTGLDRCVMNVAVVAPPG
jgi:hypothetical protein